MTTKSTPGWAARLAERMGEGATGAEPAEGATGPETSAWARVAADRAAGREPSVEDVRAARDRAVRPRTEFERRVLARLGHKGGGPTAA